jgi:hypothetical protein
VGPLISFSCLPLALGDRDPQTARTQYCRLLVTMALPIMIPSSPPTRLKVHSEPAVCAGHGCRDRGR